MDRFQKAKAARMIDGYFLPSPFEDATGRIDRSFDRAKEEAIRRFREAIDNMNSLTYEEFSDLKRKAFNP